MKKKMVYKRLLIACIDRDALKNKMVGASLCFVDLSVHNFSERRNSTKNDSNLYLLFLISQLNRGPPLGDRTRWFLNTFND